MLFALLKDMLEKHQVQAEQTKVLQLIQVWVQTVPRDLSEELRESLRQLLAASPALDRAPKIIALLAPEASRLEPLDVGLPANEVFVTVDILAQEPELVARELTRRTLYFIRAIQPADLLNRNWDAVDAEKLAPGVVMATRHFNTTCSWVQEVILSCLTPARRAAAISYFVTVATISLESFCNLNDCRAIILALTTKTISRLKMTHSAVPKQPRDTIKMLTELVSSKENYGASRTFLESKRGVPSIPCLGMLLGDLTSIEAQADCNENGINLDKMSELAKAIKRVLSIPEKYGTQITKHEVVASALARMAFVPNHELMSLSMEREPSLLR